MSLKEMSLKNLKTQRKLNKKLNKDIIAAYFLHYVLFLNLFTIQEGPACQCVLLPFQALSATLPINNQHNRMHIVGFRFFVPFFNF